MGNQIKTKQNILFPSEDNPFLWVPMTFGSTSMMRNSELVLSPFFLSSFVPTSQVEVFFELKILTQWEVKYQRQQQNISANKYMGKVK